MSPLLFAAVSVAGGFGAVARFALDALLRPRLRGPLPGATIVINLTGSLVLGLLTGFAAAAVLPPVARAVAGIGFLGGYTTFSAASLESVRLAEAGERGPALVNTVLVPLAAVALAAAGAALGGAVGAGG